MIKTISLHENSGEFQQTPVKLLSSLLKIFFNEKYKKHIGCHFFSNFSLQKYFLGMSRQNQLCKSQIEHCIFERRTNIHSRRPKSFTYSFNLNYRKIIPDHACQVLKLSEVRSGQSLNGKMSRIFLLLPKIAPMTGKTLLHHSGLKQSINTWSPSSTSF